MKTRSVKKEVGYVTAPMFEKGIDFMAKSFAKVFDKLERHDKAFDIILKEMQTYRHQSHEDRLSIGSLNHSDISQEREIEGLKIRVEKLEEKIK